jgi:serine/threonine-protein kinase
MGTAATLSPDGSVLAFVGQTAVGGASQLYVRPLASLEASPLSGTDNARNPFFSPDGRSIAFFADRKLKKVAVAGGAAVTICDAPDDRGGTWSEDGTIVFAPLGRAGLQRVSAAGGTPEVLTTPDPAAEEITHRWPHALPGGRAVLYTAHSVVGDFEDATIVAQPLPDGPRSIVQRGGYHGRYLASGHLVYMHEGRLFAAPFDPGRLALTGQPVPALEGVATAPGFAGAHFAASNRGTLVYLPGPAWGSRRILWMDPEGKTEPLRSMPDAYLGLRFSPDGQKLAIDIQEGGQRDVWLYEWERDTLSRLTVGPALDQAPIWTPDGRRIVFASDRSAKGTWNLYWQQSDGAGDAERLTESPNPQSPSSWHPTGMFLAFGEQHPRTSFDIMILPMEGDESSGWRPGKPYSFLSTDDAESSPAFSPDGRWLAYHTLDTGRADVFVRPFPGPGGKWQISTGGGRYPVWSRSGKEILFQVDDGSVWAATYAAEGHSFRAAKPRMWSSGRMPLLMLPPSTVGGVTRAFDPHPDGRRLAVLWPKQEGTAAGQSHLVFIQNFFDELRRIAPARR